MILKYFDLKVQKVFLVRFVLMAISGSQHEKLSIALRDAFQTPQRFLEFVKFRFDKNLYDITIAEDLRELAFDLIQDADSYGWIEELIIGARQSNPKNAKLFAFSQEFFNTPYVGSSLPPELSLDAFTLHFKILKRLMEKEQNR